MRGQVSYKLNAFISETDRFKKQRLAVTLKNLLEDSPEIFESDTDQDVKPIVSSAIDDYAHNPNTRNMLQLLNTLGIIGF